MMTSRSIAALALIALIGAPTHAHAQRPTGDLTPQRWEDAGKAAIVNKDYATAIHSFERAIAGNPDTAFYVADLADALRRETRFSEAAGMITSKRRRFGRLDQNFLQVRLAMVYRDWGATLKEGGKPAESIRRFKQAYAIDIALRPAAVCFDLMYIGDDWSDLHDLPRALAANLNALKIARQYKDADKETLALTSRGKMLLDARDFRPSVEYLQQALTIARLSHNTELEYTTLDGLQLAYLGAGQFEKSEECDSRLLERARNRNDTDGAVDFLCNIGRCEILRSRTSEALKSYHEALSTAKTPAENAEALNGLGEVYGILGAHEQADIYYTQAISAYKAAGDVHGALLARIAREHSENNRRAPRRKRHPAI